jgi:Flp pilus assembly protein CpaB
MTYGNSIFPGNYIDLYYKIVEDGSGKITIGKFIESIRVLAVTDGNGENIFETKDTPNSPKYLIFNKIWKLLY